jgi:hypothetical protein
LTKAKEKVRYVCLLKPSHIVLIQRLFNKLLFFLKSFLNLFIIQISWNLRLVLVLEIEVGLLSVQNIAENFRLKFESGIDHSIYCVLAVAVVDID